MKKFVALMLAVFGLACASEARADWGTHHYGGWQPKWAFWSKNSKHHASCNSEEARWRQFWHDYYDALQHYYDRLDNIDWVTYYKFHGYQINAGGQCGPYGYCGRPQYAPVFVSPTMQWAVPQAPAHPQGGACPPGFCPQ
jgi:hypothetical protein